MSDLTMERFMNDMEAANLPYVSISASGPVDRRLYSCNLIRDPQGEVETVHHDNYGQTIQQIADWLEEVWNFKEEKARQYANEMADEVSVQGWSVRYVNVEMLPHYGDVKQQGQEGESTFV